MKAKINIISGFMLLAFVAYGFSLSLKLLPPSATEYFGPGFFPKLILGCLALCSTKLIFDGVRDRKKGEKVSFQPNLFIVFKGVGLLLLLIVYVVLFFNIGFLCSTIIFLIIGELLFGIRKASWITLSSLLIAFSLYYIFSYFFKIPLP